MSKTWSVLRSEIRSDMNEAFEGFWENSQLLAWANDAQREAASELVSLYDKYFEAPPVFLTVTQGSNEVDLPTDIYANKITGLYWIDQNRSYELTQIKSKEEIMDVENTEYYRYRVYNTSTGRKLYIYPAGRETTSAKLQCFYIRQASNLVEDTDLIEVPESDNFIKQYVKDRMAEKEVGVGNFPWPSSALQTEKRILIEALNNMIPDDNSEIEVDQSIYDDFDDTIHLYRGRQY